MSRPQRWSLLLIFALAWVLLEPYWFINLGMCSCCTSSYSTCPDEAKIEQHLWDKEIYNFLYCDNCYQTFTHYKNDIHAPASNQSIYGTANYWLDSGNRLYLAGSYEQAQAAYANAVKLDPSLLDGWLNMGNALFFLGRYEESLDAYDAALRIEPQNENAFQGKNRTLLALNRTAEANITPEAA
jgi:tetratricopeptide (TPR) repeat protein